MESVCQQWVSFFRMLVTGEQEAEVETEKSFNPTSFF